MRTFSVIASAALLLACSACVSPEQQAAAAAAQRQADEAQCDGYGFKRNTDAFANCLLKLQEIRTQEENTEELRRASMPPPFWPYGFPGYRPYW